MGAVVAIVAVSAAFMNRHGFPQTIDRGGDGRRPVPVLQATEPPDHQFEVLSRLADGGLGAMPGQTVEVDVDLPASSGFTVQVMGERAEARTAWPSTRSPRAGAGAPGRSRGRQLLSLQISAPAVDDGRVWRVGP